MNIVDLAILKKMVAGGGGSGTDNYNDLLNLPQINGETLAGNKTAENLGLQDALTFDSAPTEDSTNPVESGGVFNALAGKQDNLTFDDDPTENSTNPVKSGGVYSALAGKQDNLTFDGVYNASTNKAATESTVTNAIAGLDVSAFSVDADETISSISETDGKVSVTKQDITIASNQVAAMTGYAKPSSAPSNPAIQTSDTANQAFGKLEFKADTNQSNILYTLGKTGHNLLEVTATSETVSGVEYTVNKNAITISSNGSNTTSTFVLNSGSPLFKASNNVFAIDKVMPAGATITVRYTDGSLVGFNSGNRNTNATLNNSKDVESIYIYIDANKTINDTIKVMVCTQDDWEVTHEITPYQGVSNYDLTRLEAEDRASLAEVVDSGAKNLLNISNATFGDRSKVTFNSDGSVTGAITDDTRYWSWANSEFKFTLPAGSYVLYCVATSGTNINWGLSLRKSDNSEVAIINYYTSGNYVEFTLTSATEVGFMGKIFDRRLYAMVCTKAAFGVSNKFVPYRPNYDFVCDWIAQNTWHYANKNFACSAVDTYEYTGYSVTVPAYQVFEISFTDRYSNAEPIAICISDNADPATLTGAHMLAESTGKTSTGSSYSDRCVSTLTPKLDYVNTYYVHVKHGGTGNNRVALAYRRIV